jgi:outer membrane protein assembly factor BamB
MSSTRVARVPPVRARLLIGALTGVFLIALAAGCGDSGGDGGNGGKGGGGAASPPSSFEWPYFGRVPERTHYVEKAPTPPFKVAWRHNEGNLLEFPPALGGGKLFILDKLGKLSTFDTDDGSIAWRQQLQGVSVSGPAYGEGLVFANRQNRTFYAFDAKTGKEEWHFNTSSTLQSSPLVVNGTVYFGSDNGTVYALDAESGKQRWSFKAQGPVKASLSLSSGNLYFGDYDGNIYALDASKGKQVWKTDTTNLPPGGSGGFYSSPAIAFGKLFEARDDGTVYALDLNGKLSWQKDTGKPVYGSPAVAQVKGTPPSSYIGGTSGKLYALGASDGKVRWTFPVGGPIPGTAVVVNEVVFTSSFKDQKTFGVSARTGKRVYEFPADGYTPAITDGRRVYLVGFEAVFGLDPK